MTDHTTPQARASDGMDGGAVSGPGRVFSDAELADLALSPREQVRRFLDGGNVDGAVEALLDVEGVLAAQIDRYTHWISTLFAFAAERHGAAGSAAVVHATRDLFAAHPDLGAAGPAVPDSAADEVAVAARSGDVPAALAVLDVRLERWRSLIDLYRDWISALLSDIYRRYGVDELELAHRRVGEATMRNLTANVGGPFKEMASGLVRLLTGHFSEIVELTEDDDKLTVVQDPCGTCGRQVIQGRHRPPLNLAVVTDRHAATWNRGDTTAYRTHVPIWHVEMATEQLGAPWPVNICPHGDTAGPCTIVLFKDPHHPDAVRMIPGPGKTND